MQSTTIGIVLPRGSANIGQQLLAIPGIGPTIASAALGRVSNIHAFKRGRTFAAVGPVSAELIMARSTRATTTKAE